ncbi:hypothetical protein [Martelella soudanensis]|uniref:hypothetical protein n=1 Tax=unclassified Martelella TaxID=2629616 RepID=UPI0015DD6039|nr:MULTISPECIES: hypothetical protein [unclassified Martelella]
MKRLIPTALLAFAAASPAGAAGLSDLFYIDISGGPAALMMHMNDDAMDDLIANTYWGIDGRLGICSEGMFGVCAGITGFSSLGSTSQSLSQGYGTGTSETRFSSIGGYVQGKANLGVLAISPFAGYRQLYGEVETSSSRFGYQSEDIDTGAFFGGLETSIRFIPTGLELGARIEYGASTDDAAADDFNYGLGSAFLRFKF